MSQFPVILSFDVGVIHLSYCLLTQKEHTKPDGSKFIDWHIIDWNNIDLTNRSEQKCHCGAKSSLTNIVNNETHYYCKNHGKKIDTSVKSFDDSYLVCEDKKVNKCSYEIKDKFCGKPASYLHQENNHHYCSVHAKYLHKLNAKSIQLKSFKLKSSKTLNFDDVKYSLMMELERRTNLLQADYVVIENQPSFKNPRMKSIASTLYDYYLIRGIIDKAITKSNITQVKFMSPSNKLKIANEGDTKQLVKAKSTDDTTAYKLTKSLGIKYCLELINHLPSWIQHFNSHKKKDDLADSFLQGAYFYTNNVKTPKSVSVETPKVESVVETEPVKPETELLPKTEESTSQKAETNNKKKKNKKNKDIIV